MPFVDFVDFVRREEPTNLVTVVARRIGVTRCVSALRYRISYNFKALPWF